jgi:predicted signal transduction protein with EAL and GGDEF domain
MRARPFSPGLHLTASIGICDLAAAPDADTLMARADQALYWAKAHGRDAALQWTPATASRRARRASASTRSPASPTRPTPRPAPATAAGSPT